MRRIRDRTITIHYFPKLGKSEFMFKDKRIVLTNKYEEDDQFLLKEISINIMKLNS